MFIENIFFAIYREKQWKIDMRYLAIYDELYLRLGLYTTEYFSIKDTSLIKEQHHIEAISKMCLLRNAFI